MRRNQPTYQLTGRFSRGQSRLRGIGLTFFRGVYHCVSAWVAFRLNIPNLPRSNSVALLPVQKTIPNHRDGLERPCRELPCIISVDQVSVKIVDGIDMTAMDVGRLMDSSRVRLITYGLERGYRA